MIDIIAKDVAGSMSERKAQLKDILGLFDPKSRIFYIDYPIHNNIGDMLINIATEQFFIDYQIPIQQRYSVLHRHLISKIPDDPTTTFLCHGGGNFGDLYSVHQDLREWLTEKFPRSRIICLPQSIHYSSPEAQIRSLRKFASHSNCHILARDKESLDILRNFGISHSSMMPDMAHYLWGRLQPNKGVSAGKKMYFLRRDREATDAPSDVAGAAAHHSVNWDNIVSIPHKALRSTYYLLKIGGMITPPGMSVAVWYSLRDAMIRDATGYFSKYDHVYTNRLHAMLLALLLGRDVTAFDNSYGKLSRYINAWLPSSSGRR